MIASAPYFSAVLPKHQQSTLAIPCFSSNTHERLSRAELLAERGLASYRLMPFIKSATQPNNWPRSQWIKHYKPALSWSTTPDNKHIQGYFSPAIDVTNGTIMANADNQTGLKSKHTIFLGHGYMSSPTAQLTISNVCRLLGVNVLTCDNRGHGNSRGYFRGGYTTALGFNMPLDAGSVIRDFKKKNPDHSIGILGYSMSASGTLFYPKRLNIDSFPAAARQKINPAQLKELQDVFDNLDYVIMDTPYDAIDLPTNPVMAKTIEVVSNNKWIQRLFKNPATLKQKIAKIVRHFNDVGSRDYLGISLSFKDFHPVETYKDAKLAKKPTLLIQGKHDTTTPPAVHENIKQSGVLKNARYVQLNANHSNRSLTNPTNPLDKRRYWQMLRDEKKYIKEITDFLVAQGAVDPQLLNNPTIIEALKNPNQAVLAIIQHTKTT